MVAELEESLEQTEVRARRAYAAAESAEAALRFAKERGEVIVTDPAMEQEVTRLRAQVAELMKKLGDAEQGQRRAQADATALRAGVDPDALTDPLGDEPPSPVSEGAGSASTGRVRPDEAEVDPIADSAEDEIAPRSEDVPASDAEADDRGSGWAAQAARPRGPQQEGPRPEGRRRLALSTVRLSARIPSPASRGRR